MGETELLKSLCEIHSPSGEEEFMKRFIIDYIKRYSSEWKQKPVLIQGDHLQDCLILVFGQPKVAAFAHMDTTGFTVRYQDQLIPIGGPEIDGNEILTGRDLYGEIECKIRMDDGHVHYIFGRAIVGGSSLVYKPDFSEENLYFKSPYLDNRIGIYNLLRIAETLENGALVFSAWEEHGGGSVPFLVKRLFEDYGIHKMLVSDVTWISDGVSFNNGVVVSYRDKNIPRKSYINSIRSLLIENKLEFQEEVEAYGSSDAREIQLSPYPIDWCFIGAPIENAHTNQEKIHKYDLHSMISCYKILMKNL